MFRKKKKFMNFLSKPYEKKIVFLNESLKKSINLIIEIKKYFFIEEFKEYIHTAKEIYLLWNYYDKFKN